MRSRKRWACLLCAAMLALSAAACAAQPAAQEVATPEAADAVTTAAKATATPKPTASPVPGGEETVLSATKDAGRTYVDETLFIGDSNTARYTMYADETGKAFTTIGNNIGVVSMGAQAIKDFPCAKFKNDTKTYTLPQAVAKLKPKRIIIGFGTNNLGGSSTDATKFIKNYREGLDAIVEAWPYADIIVNAIPPLDKQRENTNLTMTQVDAYNTAIAEMCAEDGYHFLNTSEVLRDEKTGWAKKDYTLSDGVHLSKNAVAALFEYVRTHAFVAEDRRPQPLGKVPQLDAVPPNLIEKDPIAVRGAKVPVEFVASTGGKISGAASQMVKKGGICSAVTAVPDDGWRFAYWTASIGSVGGSATVTFTVPGNADANGVILTAHFEPDEHEHQYVDMERTEPTCETGGFARQKCSICGEVIEKDLQPLGHQWDGGVVTQQPTETSPGVKTYTCQRNSSHTRTETIPQLAHTHNFTWVTTQEPTCGKNGSRTGTCTICGQQTTETLAATGQHTPGTEVDVGGGQMVIYCAVCGTELSRRTVETETPPSTEETTPPETEQPAPEVTDQPPQEPQPPQEGQDGGGDGDTSVEEGPTE